MQTLTAPPFFFNLLLIHFIFQLASSATTAEFVHVYCGLLNFEQEEKYKAHSKDEREKSVT